MSTVAEIEAAIEKLSGPQIDEIARWLEALRARHTAPPLPVEPWLASARGAATTGATTAGVMALTRGEE